MGRAIQQALPRCGDAVGSAATPLRRFLPLRAPLGLTLRPLLGGLLRLGPLRSLLLLACGRLPPRCLLDRKSTRLNSSHSQISYAVFCLKKKIRARGTAARLPHRAAHRSTALAVLLQQT